MASDRANVMFPLGLAGATLLALGILAWPNYRKASAVRGEMAQLTKRIEGLQDEQYELAKLALDVQSRREVVEHELKFVPPTPDIAELIRRLSVPVDGRQVIDQTFAAGQPKPLEMVEDGSLRALPVTLDMIADFESVFQTLRDIESLERLVRVISVRLVRDDKQESRVTAVVGIEAVYESGIARRTP